MKCFHLDEEGECRYHYILRSDCEAMPTGCASDGHCIPAETLGEWDTTYDPTEVKCDMVELDEG